MNDLIAPAGSKVLCPKGHQLCELSHDLRVGLTSFTQVFVNWRQPKPAPSDREIKCAICNSTVFSEGRSNFIFRPAKEVRQLPW